MVPASLWHLSVDVAPGSGTGRRKTGHRLNLELGAAIQTWNGADAPAATRLELQRLAAGDGGAWRINVVDARTGKGPYPAGRAWDRDALSRGNRPADIDSSGAIADRDRAVQVGAGCNGEVVAYAAIDGLCLSAGRNKKQR